MRPRQRARVFALVLLVALTVWVFVTFRRRRERGQHATGWLVALVILGLLCLGALANAAGSGS
jgi:RsiW-degrading membrane proteinase PrsW (M82 family)